MQASFQTLTQHADASLARIADEQTMGDQIKAYMASPEYTCLAKDKDFERLPALMRELNPSASGKWEEDDEEKNKEEKKEGEASGGGGEGGGGGGGRSRKRKEPSLPSKKKREVAHSNKAMQLAIWRALAIYYGTTTTTTTSTAKEEEEEEYPHNLAAKACLLYAIGEILGITLRDGDDICIDSGRDKEWYNVSLFYEVTSRFFPFYIGRQRTDQGVFAAVAPEELCDAILYHLNGVNELVRQKKKEAAEKVEQQKSKKRKLLPPSQPETQKKGGNKRKQVGSSAAAAATTASTPIIIMTAEEKRLAHLKSFLYEKEQEDIQHQQQQQKAEEEEEEEVKKVWGSSREKKGAFDLLRELVVGRKPWQRPSVAEARNLAQTSLDVTRDGRPVEQITKTFLELPLYGLYTYDYKTQITKEEEEDDEKACKDPKGWCLAKYLAIEEDDAGVREPLNAVGLNSLLVSIFAEGIDEPFKCLNGRNKSIMKLLVQSNSFRRSVRSPEMADLRMPFVLRPYSVSTRWGAIMWWFFAAFARHGGEETLEAAESKSRFDRHVLRLYDGFFSVMLYDAKYIDYMNGDGQLQKKGLGHKITEWGEWAKFAHHVSSSLLYDEGPVVSESEYISNMYALLHEILPWPFSMPMSELAAPRHTELLLQLEQAVVAGKTPLPRTYPKEDEADNDSKSDGDGDDSDDADADADDGSGKSEDVDDGAMQDEKEEEEGENVDPEVAAAAAPAKKNKKRKTG